MSTAFISDYSSRSPMTLPNARSGLDQAIQAIWDGYIPNGEWTVHKSPYEPWYSTGTVETDGLRGVDIHLNLLRAHGFCVCGSTNYILRRRPLCRPRHVWHTSRGIYTAPNISAIIFSVCTFYFCIVDDVTDIS